MICNPAKFQAITLENRESDLASRNKKKIGNQNIQVDSVVHIKALGVHIDHKLNFNLRRQHLLVCIYPTECR